MKVDGGYRVAGSRVQAQVVCGEHATFVVTNEQRYACCPECGRVYTCLVSIDVELVGGTGTGTVGGTTVRETREQKRARVARIVGPVGE